MCPFTRAREAYAFHSLLLLNRDWNVNTQLNAIIIITWKFQPRHKNNLLCLGYNRDLLVSEFLTQKVESDPKLF